MLESLQSSRSIAIASLACIVGGAIACGSEPEVAVTVEPPVVVAGGPGVVAGGPGVAAPPTAMVVPDDVAPAHGGTLVMAGSYPVEVVPHESGQVYAYVHGEAPPPDGTELTVVVPVTGGVRPVELTWEPGEARWGGRVRHDTVVAGPIDVVLVVGGARWVGHVATFVVLPAIVIVDSSPSIVVIEHAHGKHRKHRGRGHGRGHWR